MVVGYSSATVVRNRAKWATKKMIETKITRIKIDQAATLRLKIG